MFLRQRLTNLSLTTNRPLQILKTTLLTVATLIFLLSGESAEARYAAFVIDVESGRVLHETNADTRNHPASLTKMMTLYMLFEALQDGRVTADQELKVSRRAAGMPNSKLGLKRGETINADDAILALVTKSANDVAVVIAETLAPTESEFAQMMTKKAKALGMNRTSFRNASGLYNRRQLSTARDMAILAQALIRDFPERYKTFSVRTFSHNGRVYRNHNKLLRSYQGAISCERFDDFMEKKCHLKELNLRIHNSSKCCYGLPLQDQKVALTE